MMRLGIGPVGGKVGGHGIDLLAEFLVNGIDLLAEAFIYRVNLFIQCINHKRVVLDLFAQLIEPGINFFVKCGMSLKHQIKLAANVFRQGFQLNIQNSTLKTAFKPSAE